MNRDEDFLEYQKRRIETLERRVEELESNQNKRAIEELEKLCKEILPTIRKEYRIGEFPDRDTHRFIDGVYATILTLGTRIKQLEDEKNK
jgi:hypothetical protein